MIQFREKLLFELTNHYEIVETQVRVEFGIIDILTPDEIIEIKRISGWKSAIGQLLAYGRDFPDKHLRMHLFGRVRTDMLQKITEICHCVDISVTHETI